MDDKEKLRQALLLDMKHWSVDTLKAALSYVDGMYLSQTGEDRLWWQYLQKAIEKELDARERVVT